MWSKKTIGKIFIVSGSSGSGKTTLLKMLRAGKDFRDNPAKIITVTTRPPRFREKVGRDYQFVDRNEFLKRKTRGEFIESQEIFGDYYATPKKDLLRVIHSGQDALLCIDVKGAFTVKRIFPKEAVLIFIMVSKIESLRKRLSLRSSESRESLKRRLKTAKEEMACSKCYDYIIVNDALKEALKKLSAVIMAEKLRVK